MRATDIIRKKRDGQALTPEEIEAFVQGATRGAWPPYQLAALLMAIVLRGMTPEETAELTAAMVRSGEVLDLSDLPGIKVDKHSTGGVGDKTSLILAPLVAACGVIVPMMSGRGLGHTGGTLDKLEAIPWFRVNLTLEEFRSVLRQVGCAMIGQTAEIAPADKVLYALRDVTGTVESVPLISASIMSKKIAEGIDSLVLDVKCGRGAFMKTPEDARRLAESLVAIGKANGVPTDALITAMDAPLGQAVGNAVEVMEALNVLKGHGPKELTQLSVLLAARMVLLAGLVRTQAEAEAKVQQTLASGAGVEKFRLLVEKQGGDPRVVDDYHRFPTAPNRSLVRAARGGFVVELDAELIGRGTMVLGAGRDRVEDTIDPAVGAWVRAGIGQKLRAGEPLVELVYRDATRLEEARQLITRACVIADAPPEPQPLVREVLS